MSLKENSPTYPLGQVSALMDYQTSPSWAPSSYIIVFGLFQMPVRQNSNETLSPA